ncbi:MAG: AI-2E family transporter [Chloroflexi bacterium]|nr:AI-2E family transporter [Chloroflexota bacterium]
MTEPTAPTNPPPYTPQWDRTTRYLVTVGLVIFGIWVLTLLSPVLTMLVISFIISFLMYRPALFLCERWRIPWAAAVIILYITVGLLLTLAVVLLIPEAISGFNIFAITVERAHIDLQRVLLNHRPEWGLVDILGFSFDINPLIMPLRGIVLESAVETAVSTRVENVVGAAGSSPVGSALESAVAAAQETAAGEAVSAAVETFRESSTGAAVGSAVGTAVDIVGDVGVPAVASTVVRQAIDPSILQDTLGQLFSVASTLTNFLTRLVGGVAGLLTSVLLGSILSLLFLLDMPRNRNLLYQLTNPIYHREFALLIAQLQQTWWAFFRGQVALALIVAVLTYIQLTITGITGALLFAILTGFLVFIPAIGGFIALIPQVAAGLLSGSTTFPEMSHILVALLVILGNIVISQIVWNILSPKIMGDALKLPTAVVICAVFVGAALGGLLGAFLIAPMTSSVRIVVRYLLNKIGGQDPFPDYPLSIPSGTTIEPASEAVADAADAPA